MCWMSAVFVTSTRTNTASPPASLISLSTETPSTSRRAARTTRAPSVAIAIAAALPSPEDAPVTKVTLPSSDPIPTPNRRGRRQPTAADPADSGGRLSDSGTAPQPGANVRPRQPRSRPLSHLRERIRGMTMWLRVVSRGHLSTRDRPRAACASGGEHNVGNRKHLPSR